MEIEYELDEAGFVNANQFSYLKRTLGRRVRLWAFRLAGVGSIVLSLPQLLGRERNLLGGAYLLIFGLACCFFSEVTKFMAKRKFRKMTGLHGRYVINIDHEGLSYVAPQGEGKMNWQVFGSFGEDSNSFVLVQRGANIIMPIPKRNLSVDQIDQLRSAFETYLPSK